jgi:ligand-binding SRPBCC domain-containing protein
MAAVTLTFSSDLAAQPDRVWRWMTSMEGISREMSPLMKMTAPSGVASLTDLHFEPGARLFRSWILLFGVLPIDRSDLTLVSLDPGEGFVEQSPMFSMKLWRHERRLEAVGGGTTLTDTLTFEPRFVTGLTRWFIRMVFEHRHAVLRRSLGERGQRVTGRGAHVA